MEDVGVGALMNDGWSKFGTYYVGIFAQDNWKFMQKIGTMKTTFVIPSNVLLSMRQMG